MNNNTVKTIISLAVLVVLAAIAISILKFAVTVLLPLAVVVVAAYIIYMFVTKRRR